MWTRYAGKIVISWATAQGLVFAGRRNLLPVTLQGNDAYLIGQADVVGKAFCADMKVIGQRQVEPLCVFCQSAMRCAIGSQCSGDFKLIGGFSVGWGSRDLSLVLNTCEVPFLAALRKSQWKLFGAREELRFNFSLCRLKSGIKKLQKAAFGELLQRPDICWYIHRKHSGGRELRDLFTMKLRGLERRLKKFKSSAEFDEQVKALHL